MGMSSAAEPHATSLHLRRGILGVLMMSCLIFLLNHVTCSSAKYTQVGILDTPSSKGSYHHFPGWGALSTHRHWNPFLQLALWRESFGEKGSSEIV